MHKNLFLFGFFFLAIYANAQISIGSGGVFIGAGTPFTAQSLVLIPQNGITIANNKFEQTTTPATFGNGVNGIARVVSFESPLSFSGTIRLNFDESELNGNTVADLKLAYYDATKWSSSTSSVVNAANSYIEETVTAKSFDSVTAAAYFSTLPVSLLSFTARLQSNARVLLQWRTASEQFNSHFLVDRSSDGRLFKTIGSVQAAGSTGAAYSFIDEAPLAGSNYYRLKQIDRDGSEQAFGVRVVKTGQSTASLVIYPNPVGERFQLVLPHPPAKPITYTIQSVAGYTVQTGKINNREQWLETRQMPAGVYVLELENGQRVRFIRK